MSVTITNVTVVSGSAGGSTREADIVLRVTGSADTVEAVRQYVEQAVVKPVAKRSNERSWDDALNIDNARQGEIVRGDIVRAYDFPGSRDDVYVEGVVKGIDTGDRVLIHVTREVWQGEDEQVSRFDVYSPLGVSSMSGAPCVFLIAKRKAHS